MKQVLDLYLEVRFSYFISEWPTGIAPPDSSVADCRVLAILFGKDRDSLCNIQRDGPLGRND